MNWITTNIRLPEDVYMELKMKAAKERKSIAAIIREKIVEPKRSTKTDAIFKKLHKLQKQISKEAKNVNLTEALIKDRYEHV